LRVLVVHDRAERMEEIAKLVVTHGGSRCVVDRARDMVEGRDRLREHHYDLAIVDLTIPTAHGMASTGIQNADWLLQAAFEGSDLKTPADVIAISVDGAAVRLIRSSIGEHVLAVITEDPDGVWRSQLGEKLRYVRNTRRSRMLAANSMYDVDIALMTALRKEALPYHSLLELTESDEFVSTWEFTVRSKSDVDLRGVLTSVCRPGQAPMAAMTQSVLTQFRPKAIIMTGFCGGVEGKLFHGDVAAFTSSTPWDYGKWIETKTAEGIVPRFLPRQEAVPIPAGGLERILLGLDGRETLLDVNVQASIDDASGGRVTASKIRSVAAGSGSSVVTSENTLGRIVDANDSIHAIDMESHAFYHTCRNTPVVRPDYLCIKAVADHCNGLKDDALHAVCSELSARIALEIVCEHFDFSI
jgi:nucleoside phosphorylase